MHAILDSRWWRPRWREGKEVSVTGSSGKFYFGQNNNKKKTVGGLNNLDQGHCIGESFILFLSVYAISQTYGPILWAHYNHWNLCSDRTAYFMVVTVGDTPFSTPEPLPHVVLLWLHTRHLGKKIQVLTSWSSGLSRDGWNKEGRNFPWVSMKIRKAAISQDDNFGRFSMVFLLWLFLRISAQQLRDVTK